MIDSARRRSILASTCSAAVQTRYLPAPSSRHGARNLVPASGATVFSLLPGPSFVACLSRALRACNTLPRALHVEVRPWKQGANPRSAGGAASGAANCRQGKAGGPLEPKGRRVGTMGRRGLCRGVAGTRVRESPCAGGGAATNIRMGPGGYRRFGDAGR